MKTKKSKITPGKWEITGKLDMLRVEKRRHDGSWALIAEVHTEDHNVPRYEEAEANANLIASAPKLLKALQDLCNQIAFDLPIEDDPKMIGLLMNFNRAKIAIKQATQ